MSGTARGHITLGCGLSGHHDASLACAHVLEQIAGQLDGRGPAAAFVFFSGFKPDAAAKIGETLARGLGTDVLAGMSAAGVVGGRVMFERRAGVAALVLAGDGIRGTQFGVGADAMPTSQGPAYDADLAHVVGIGDEHRASFVFVDAGSMPTGELLPALGRAAGGRPILGGTAMRPETPDAETILIHGGRVQRGGMVGVSLSGAVEVRTLVAQGCKAVGHPVVVTASRNNLVMEMAGRPAIAVLRELAQKFAPGDRPLLAGGLYLGVAVDEYRERFGRGDFVVSRIIGGDEQAGYIALENSIPTGRTVQLHLRDPTVARADLDLLLDVEKLHDRPAGVLLLTDLARGRTMFDEQWSDAVGIARAFDQLPAGEAVARAGYEISSHEGPVPVAGAMTTGQIGPIGGTTRLLGLTACAALFREMP